MPRIRTIKPEFWEDEVVGEWSLGARLVFLCGLNYADDYGVVRGDAAFLRSRAFAYDDVTLNQTHGFLTECSLRLRPFINGGQTYRVYVNWNKHQRVNRPSSIRNPAPPPQDPESTWVSDDSLMAHGGLSEGSQLDLGSRILDQGSRKKERPAETFGYLSGDGAGLLDGDSISAKARRVFVYYCRSHKKRSDTLLDSKLQKLVVARINEGRDEKYIQQAIDGILKIPFNVREKKTSLALICRDNDHVQKYYEAFEDPPKPNASGPKPYNYDEDGR